MRFKPTPIASAVAFALSGMALQAHGQTPPPAKKADVETITVTGIRASLERSIETKRNADSVIEVITADDVGKLPDKNIADAVQRVPGVTISSASGGEGGFDENDRVSMRGTNPSLTQTLINGHAVASGDWFVLDQVSLVGRSVSFSLLPSELVSQVIVRKSATADLVEGGVAGAVDIITRRPLQFTKPITLEGSAGLVYADLPKKTDGQFSGLVNWKNNAGTMGVMLQGFSEDRHLRRDGQETLGYAQVAAGSALATAHPDLVNAYYPTLIGSTLFEQKRERKGGLIDIEIKPTNDLDLNLSAFTSKMEATNYNRNWMFWGAHVFPSANLLPSSYTLSGNTITAANFPNIGTADNKAQYAIVDNIYRPGSYAKTDFVNLDGKWSMTDRFTLSGQVGSTKGKGVTPKQDVFEGDVFNTGATYQMHGVSSPVDVAYPSGNPSNFAGTSLDWIFGASPAGTNDEEKYGQLDGELTWDKGAFSSIKFGGRWSEHKRDTFQVAQGPNFAADPFNAANLPAWNGTTYPGNFASGLGGNFPRNVWQLDPGILEQWGDLYSNRDPLAREFWSGEFSMKEKVTAGYVMASFEGQGFSGNVGGRLVSTKEEVTVNVGVPGDVCAVQAPCPQVPNAITTSAFGTFYKNTVRHTYTDFLPSANLRFDLGNNQLIRVAAARTIARPDYSALGGSITADDTTHTGNGGNPDLKPIRSNNLDLSWEWYYGPRSLVTVGGFLMNLNNYVAFGTHPITLLNIRTNTFDTYNISAPINSSGSVKGMELSWQQPLSMGFGFQANYTYANASEDNGAALVGASKNTYNAVGYWENHGFSARLAYTYRSHFFVGLDRSTPEYQDDTGTLGASIGYQLTKNVSLNFDGLNLNDPILKYYGINKDQPRAFYRNGRQYYFTVRVKL
jgi:iron complex outermembrane receptor protein